MTKHSDINVDLYSLLANIPGVASKNIHELETIFKSNLKKYKKNLVKAQHLMRLTEAIMSETERKLARKAREIVQENSWDSTHLLMVDKNTLAPQIYGSHQQDSSTKLTDEQVKGLRNYILQLKDGEMVSYLDAYKAMPEDNTWQGNIFPSNPGRKPEVDDVTKALGKFAFDFLVGDVVTILDPEALTEDKLIAAAMMLPPAKVVKLVSKLKDLEKMKDTIDNLDDVSDKMIDSSVNLNDASKVKVTPKTIDDIISDTTETTNGVGVARNFEKSGGFDQTLKDFESLNPTNVKDIQTKYGPGKVGALSDGTTVVARPGSTTGGPTLEVKVSKNKVFKIRY